MTINFVPDNFSEFNQTDFASDILKGIGLTPTPERLKFMLSWFKAEGVKPYAFNPLATTWKMPGSTYYNCLKKDASGACIAGVQSYPDYNTGVQATVKTLNQSFYNNIRNALAANISVLPENDPGLEKDFKTWGTTYTLFKKVHGSVSSTPTQPKFLETLGKLGKLAAVTGILLTIANKLGEHEA